MRDRARWQSTIAHAVAAATVPWQYASLATGLVGLAAIVVRRATIPLAACLPFLALQLALLAAGLWLSLRLRIDAALFQALAEEDGTGSFDEAMVALGMLSTAKAGRPMPERIAGLMRLVRLLALVVAGQLAVLIVTGWLLWR
ncbi:hypothetical protein [Sphingomonas sp.]|uniref:hypothetical protein n=1 Tax=Sphingomonas sp. TaxID=28214 RepID=UPI003B3A9059